MQSGSRGRQKLCLLRKQGKKDADFDAELKEVLGKMYEKYVPQAVREYIESRGDVPPAIKKANRQQGKNSVASGSAAENE